MMTSILRKSTLLIAFVFAISVNSQNFRGKATYIKKAKLSESIIKQVKALTIPEHAKDRFIKQATINIEGTFTLSFSKNTSIYKKNEKLDIVGKSKKLPYNTNSDDKGHVFMDIKSKKSINSPEYLGKRFLISQELEQVKWKLEKETKKIGGYTCFKATSVKIVPNIESTLKSISNAGTMTTIDKLNQEEKTKNVLVTAWYTPEIPVSQGPNMNWGLPGLILELKEGRDILLCTKISLKESDKVKEIKPPRNGKKVSLAEYEAIVKKKKKEMTDRFKRPASKGNRGNRRS